jgi:serine/threonine-protein kinase
MEHLDPDVLAAYVDGRLTAEQIAVADRHVDSCRGCRDELSALAHAHTRQPVIADGSTRGAVTPLERRKNEEAAATLPAVAGQAEAYCATCGQSYAPEVTHCPQDGAALVRLAARASWTGRVLDGRFELGEPLGKGGMGTVYNARQLSVDREVAVKVIRQAIADEPEVAKRFLREARLASRLVATGLVSIFDFGQTAEGELYLVMELVHGKTLSSIVEAAGRLPAARVVPIALQLCDALEAAHAAGIIHRDLKPGNVMILDEPRSVERVKVLDFGLAKSITSEGTTKLTATDALLGTPLYMAPEQITGQPVDARTDLYALGCVLYEMLAGKPPFADVTMTLVLAMHTGTPPPPLPADVPAPLAATVMRLLEKAPERRYASAGELGAALAASTSAAGSTPVSTSISAPALAHRRTRLLAIAGAIAVVASGAAYVASQRQPESERVAPSRAAIHFVPRASSNPEPERPQAILPDPARPATPPPAPPITATGTIRVIVDVANNQTGNPVLDRVVDLAISATVDCAPRLDRMSTDELVEAKAELEAQRVASPTSQRVGQFIAERDHVPVLVLATKITGAGAGASIELVASDMHGTRVAASSMDVPLLADVPTAATRLASNLRRALGEKLNEDDQCRLTRNLDAAYEFAVADSMLVADLPRAIEHLERAVAKDPVFPLAHIELALAYQDAGRLADMRAQQQLVLSSLDKLGERERLAFLGTYYYGTTGDYERAANSFEQLLAKWPRSVIALSNLPYAYEAMHDVHAAVTASERAVQQYPRDFAIRTNHCGHILMAGEPEKAIACARRTLADFPAPDPWPWRVIARGAALTGRHADASDAIAKLAQLDASAAATYAADIAIAEGRPTEAQSVLERQLAVDLAAKASDAVAAERELLAEARWLRGDRTGARAAAAGSVPLDPQVACLTGLVLAESGADAAAATIAARLAVELPRSTRALGKLIEGERLRARGEPSKAMIVFQDALRLDDLVLGHWLLARAAIDARHFPEAFSELQTCTSREGELASTLAGGLRFAATMPYYLAKAKEGLGNSDAGTAYRAYLNSLHDPDPTDPLVVDARAHAR